MDEFEREQHGMAETTQPNRRLHTIPKRKYLHEFIYKRFTPMTKRKKKPIDNEIIILSSK